MKNINFSGEITQDRVERLLEELRDERSVTPNVRIDSPGGTFEFFSIFGPSLRRTGFTSIGQNVRSAAITLFLLGDKRYVLPDACFHFHEVRTIIGPDGTITLHDLESALNKIVEMEVRQQGMTEKLQEWHRSLRNAQEWMIDLITQRSGMAKPILRNLMRNEVILTAAEAVQYGIAHKIISPEELYVK